MPDIPAPRPVDGQNIETGWGQAVHDTVESIQSGIATILAAPGGWAGLAVVFDRAYAVPPVVVTGVRLDNLQLPIGVIAHTDGITNEGMTLWVENADGSPIAHDQRVHWIAIGVLASLRDRAETQPNG